MNTKGHRGVGERGAVPLFEEALKRTGQQPRGLEAVLLGNWLTDVSQMIDPVAYAAGATAIQDKVESFIRVLTSRTAYRSGRKILGTWVGDLEERLIKAAKEWVYNSIIFLLGADSRTKGAIQGIITDAIFVKGYFKFAFAEEQGKPERLTIEEYEAIFRSRFTQYFPHEHVDRPALPTSPVLYEAHLDRGPRSTGAPRYPDLYRYLRDDIVILAGGFTELDLDWARPLARGEIVTDGSDTRFGVGLARLGHLLHAVEDFFAHSNFVELHASANGAKYLPKSFETRDAGIYARRLKRWRPSAETVSWERLAAEDFVVTGYFDFSDTLVSLSHAFEELLGIGWRDPRRRVGDVFRATESTDFTRIEEEYYEWLQSLLELLSNPKVARESADNRIVKLLEDTFGEDLEALTKPELHDAVLTQVLARTQFLRNVPAGVVRRIRNLVVAVSKPIAVGKLTFSAYRAIDTLIELFADPLGFLMDVAKDQGIDAVKESALFLSKDLLWYQTLLAGSDHRIGSHSLLAKDTGSEWLYGYQRACATAAHYTIVKNLLRWISSPPHDDRVIDWLAMLESLLCNPSAAHSGRAEVATVEVVAPGSPDPRSVVDQIGRVARDGGIPDTPESPAWLAVARPSFDVRGGQPADLEKVCSVAARALSGAPKRLPVSARGELLLLVPGQQVTVLSRPSRATETEPPWPAAVFERETKYPGRGWEVARGFKSFTQGRSVAATELVEVRFIDEPHARAAIAAGEDLRLRSEQAYNSLAIPPSRP
jgi:hypothetical protein